MCLSYAEAELLATTERVEVMNHYDQWLQAQEEQFENADDERTREELVESGVLADDED